MAMNIVSAEDIEEIVGAKRFKNLHIARAVSSEQTVYILHSQRCFDSTGDLRDCVYSQALSWGIDTEVWSDFEDRPVVVSASGGEELWPSRSLDYTIEPLDTGPVG